MGWHGSEKANQVIQNPGDTGKLILPHGIPETVEQFMDEVREVCELNGHLRMQYQDNDFFYWHMTLV